MESRSVFLSMGSNLGDRRKYLEQGVTFFSNTVSISPIYETEAVGGPDQGPYLNLVAQIHTSKTPKQLLYQCQQVESEALRERKTRWGPRTLDVDILLFDKLNIQEPDLTIPHPRMWQRRFVLQPLSDVAPELVPPKLLEASLGSVRWVGNL